MKNTIRFVQKTCTTLASSLVLGALLVPSALAQVSDTATTSATVVEPIAIVNAQDLSFGEFAAGTGGTVELTSGGVASRGTGDIVVTGGTATAAQFTVTGAADASFEIAISDNELTHTDTSTTMALVTNHDLTGSAGDDPATGTLTGGTQTIYVGGTLTVANAQIDGVYSGTITATVNYN